MIAAGNDNILSQFEQYLSQIELSPKTITNYLADLRVFLRWAETTYNGNFSLVHISPDQIRAYRRHLLEENRAPSTINRHLQALRKCCAYLSQTKLSPINAAAEIPLVRMTTQKTVTPLSAAQVDRLLQAAQNTRSSIAKRDIAIMHLLVYAGLRVAEIVDLQMDDVDFDFPGVHLNVRDKRGGVRNLPLPDAACTALKNWLVIRPQTANYSNVFLSQEGRPISARTVQRIVNRCARDANIAHVTPQLLRRTYAYRLWEQTGDIGLVCVRLGHQHTGITAQYLNVPVNGKK